MSARLQQVGTLLASRRAGPALGALLASYALIAGALITAYQWLQFWRQGHWTPLLVGSLWEYFVGSRPFFAVREIQTLVTLALDLPLAIACFGLFGAWVVWRVVLRHLFLLGP